MDEAALLQQIAQAVRSVRYGTVNITIHDARIVQIEKSEKIRLEKVLDRTTGETKQQEGVLNASSGTKNTPGRALPGRC